ncbi:ABC transporter permease subunit [Embleya sp. NBC_00888]|uniref:ABC transporter permease subunit n=1 Tax=Embleya sp. NBC_00888 TaxID=2975960 RepID=UPI003867F199|nr:ABC transporter permease subunit [Embleya sp. NBC_00888]
MADPTTTTPYRSPLTGGRDGFGGLLRAEWTKLRSVRRWLLTLTAAAVLTVLVGLLIAGGSGIRDVSSGGGQQKVDSADHFADGGQFVERELAGDGELVARVSTQERSAGRAKAGLMIRASDAFGAAYAAVVVTPDHGVRLHSGYDSDRAGGGGPVPRWLKLVRADDTITAYESSDGAGWRRVGRVDLDDLPRTARIGLFVSSPDAVKVERAFGSEGISSESTTGKATFDHVSLKPAPPQQPAGTWQNRAGPGGAGASAGPATEGPDAGPPPGFTEVDGTFTVIGRGDIGPDRFGEDATQTILGGVLIALIAVVALGVVSITAEFHRDTIRTTFAATPRRGRVLAAKAIVVGAATFVAGLVGAFGTFLATGPVERSKNRIPAGLSDPNVLRALIGTAVLLAVAAVFALAVGAILRRGAPAITLVLALLLIPRIVGSGLPVSTGAWLERLTPSAGFAIQRTFDRYDTTIAPWAGLGVLCAYTAVALALAAWRLRERDA